MFKRCALVFGLVLTAFTSSPADAMRVSPMQLEMAPIGRASASSISVVNTGPAKMPVEVLVTKREIDAAGNEYQVPAEEPFLVFPPMAAIPPGATQVFRVQWVGEPELAEAEAYYVTVKQIPVELEAGQSGLQIAYAFAVATHVNPEGAEPRVSVRRATPMNEGGKPGLKLQVSNQGQGYTYLSRALIDARGADGSRVNFDEDDIRAAMESSLLLPGSTREVVLPLPRAMRGPVQVDLDLRSLDEVLN